MNRLVLVMTAKAGKTREAIAGLKAIADYAGSKYDRKAEVYMQVFGGTSGTFYAIADYKDLADAQAALARIMADDKYMTLSEKLSEALIGPPTVTFLQPI
jgi:hypothetical protein